MMTENLKPEDVNRSTAMLRIICFVFIVIFELCIFNEAYAHKVNIYAYAEDGKIYSEGYFVDGSKCKNSLVEVFDLATGEKLLEGRTGEGGQFVFEIPRTASLKLVLNASMGHKNDYIVTSEEVRDAIGISKAEVRSQKSEVREQNTESGSQIPEPTGASPAVTQGLSSSEVEAIVDRTIEKKLKPIKNILLQILESLSKPGISEILGGIGYILGLMGIAMYFKSRRR